MKIAVGADHAGWKLKDKLARHLKELGHEVIDMGTNGDQSVDYPNYAGLVCDQILSGRAEKGLLICGTGIGMAMAANRKPGIRAANCHEILMARLSRGHNNSNILTMGARIIAFEMAAAITDAWLEAPYDGDRHNRRLAMLDAA